VKWRRRRRGSCSCSCPTNTLPCLLHRLTSSLRGWNTKYCPSTLKPLATSTRSVFLLPLPPFLDAFSRFTSDGQIATTVQRLSAVQPHLLAELRPLERKMGLILTLFKGLFSFVSLFRRVQLTKRDGTASVWSLLRQREDQQLYEEELRL
jgi:hypothetical protein